MQKGGPMRRKSLQAIGVLTVFFTAIACGGDDSGDGNGAGGASAGAAGMNSAGGTT